MGLKIEDQKIVGKIDKLRKKLEGNIPITKEELIVLINSWGRENLLYINGTNEETIQIKLQNPKECYDLSQLDTSQITNMDNIFSYSKFNGDISSWNTSNVTSMILTFKKASYFNSDIGNWDVSNIKNMRGMFYYAIEFNQNINSWNVSNVVTMASMFYGAKKFNQPLNNWNTKNLNYISNIFCEMEKFNQNIGSWKLDNIISADDIFVCNRSFYLKYNNGKPMPNETKDFLNWLNNNRDRMNEIDIKLNYGEKINDFFSKINHINSLTNFV